MASDIVSKVDRRWYMLIFVMLLEACRIGQVAFMSIVTDPIKSEFNLSDSGTAFIVSFIYAIVAIFSAIPLGIVADRGNRTKLIVASGFLFSLFFAAPILASSYFLLLISRIGVGLGHAGMMPLKMSFLADKFGARDRATAFMLLPIGGSAGAWAAIAGGGYLTDLYSWRFAMFVLGMTSLAVTIGSWMVLREPERGGLDGIPVANRKSLGFLATMTFAMRQRSVRHCVIGCIVINFWIYGMAWWLAPFLTRSFGISVAKASALLGAVHGTVGVAAVIITFFILDKIGKDDPVKPLWFLTIASAILTVPAVIMAFTHSLTVAMIMMWLFLPMGYIYIGPVYAAVSTGVLPDMRGQVSAVMGMVSGIASTAIAPMTIGFISDLVAPRISNPLDSVRYALLPIALTGLWAALHFWLASKYVKEDQLRVATHDDHESPNALDRSRWQYSSTTNHPEPTSIFTKLARLRFFTVRR
ncbi:MFS transporter [Sphingomonadaceae bacterium G21617-S1]|jgi:predicted MFS family arabinose efflux permease|nr:MFS transporter [Sphingomonadaceae bacterium G21617-S1]